MKNYFFILLVSVSFNTIVLGQNNTQTLPNILWISWEDAGPQLGAYGDEYAKTPNIDKLANEGLVYLNAYSNYPVCAMSRSTIITGQYASSYGGQHMRSRSIPEKGVHLFPELLRKSGYYCTNDSKADYQIGFDQDIVWDRMGKVWDPTDYRTLWEGKKPEQPFFTVINLTTTHEGYSRTTNTEWVETLEQELSGKRHNPENAPVPPYLPDTENTRLSIAQYYDNLTYTDSISGIILRQLEESGMDKNTIVMFWGDHGWGLPRGKRWPYQSGLHVPLIIRIPQQYEQVFNSEGRGKLVPGTKSDELVSFVDFAPTILSLAGIKIPDYMHGKAFLGSQASKPGKYVYGGRGRMDETYDCMRTVIDKDYLYIRNFMWHLPYVQTIRTMETHPVMQELRELHKNNVLTPAQKTFFQYPKPVEELYDLKSDPHQIHNLANNRKYSDILQHFRNENTAWMLKIEDIGLIPEPELDALKWPDGLWPETDKPVVKFNNRNYWNGQAEISISCPTPGASIAWKNQTNSHWQLYTKPIVIGPDQWIQVKAHRLGFYASPLEYYWLGKTDGNNESKLNEYTEWQDKVDQNLFKELLEIKNLEIGKNTSLNDYYKYLNYENASMRYWAIAGIHANAISKAEKEQVMATLLEYLDDPSPVVRIEAAYGVCKMGNIDNGMPVLRDALQHTQESVRLFALNHLDKMGEKARHVLPFPEIPAGTANNYSHRIMIRIYKRLGIQPKDLDYASPEQLNDIQRIYNTIFTENLWEYGF